MCILCMNTTQILNHLRGSDFFEKSQITENYATELDDNTLLLGSHETDPNSTLMRLPSEHYKGVMIHYWKETDSYEIVCFEHDDKHGFISSTKGIKQEKLVEYLTNTVA
jgi:hypothetical protein